MCDEQQPQPCNALHICLKLSDCIMFLWQADEPQTNFKGQYDEEYRQQHPTAPVIVPWISGVTAS